MESLVHDWYLVEKEPASTEHLSHEKCCWEKDKDPCSVIQNGFSVFEFGFSELSRCICLCMCEMCPAINWGPI